MSWQQNIFIDDTSYNRKKQERWKNSKSVVLEYEHEWCILNFYCTVHTLRPCDIVKEQENILFVTQFNNPQNNTRIIISTIAAKYDDVAYFWFYTMSEHLIFCFLNTIFSHDKTNSEVTTSFLISMIAKYLTH